MSEIKIVFITFISLLLFSMSCYHNTAKQELVNVPIKDSINMLFNGHQLVLNYPMSPSTRDSLVNSGSLNSLSSDCSLDIFTSKNKYEVNSFFYFWILIL